MTVAQLKRHMDRRFDHLERTKADRSDLKRFATKTDTERGFARLDAKLDGVLAVVLSIRDTLDRVADEHDRRISDLERHVFGQGRLFPEA
ncbi:MAG: hypothetical protein LAO77_16910 [Acidobacteriia bacterium]|nr:hypothetical protein [Terriglobia bacterium]